MARVRVDLYIWLEGVSTTPEVHNQISSRLKSVGLGDHDITKVTVVHGEFDRSVEDPYNLLAPLPFPPDSQL